MICNVIDNRRNPHRWKRVQAIVEPTWHDNSPDSDQAERIDDEISYDERDGISLAEAVAWANAFKDPVTLYVYDEGEGTRPVTAPEEIRQLTAATAALDGLRELSARLSAESSPNAADYVKRVDHIFKEVLRSTRDRRREEGTGFDSSDAPVDAGGAA